MRAGMNIVGRPDDRPESRSGESMVVAASLGLAPVYPKTFGILREVVRVRIQCVIPGPIHLWDAPVVSQPHLNMRLVCHDPATVVLRSSNNINSLCDAQACSPSVRNEFGRFAVARPPGITGSQAQHDGVRFGVLLGEPDGRVSPTCLPFLPPRLGAFPSGCCPARVLDAVAAPGIAQLGPQER